MLIFTLLALSPGARPGRKAQGAPASRGGGLGAEERDQADGEQCRGRRRHLVMRRPCGRLRLRGRRPGHSRPRASGRLRPRAGSQHRLTKRKSELAAYWSAGPPWSASSPTSPRILCSTGGSRPCARLSRRTGLKVVAETRVWAGPSSPAAVVIMP
jgi:hypothetical protein